MPLKHIIFDYDGVIADSFSFHHNNLHQLGYAISEQEYRDLHNGNFYENQNETMESFDATRYANYVKDDQTYVPLFPNAHKVIEKLHSKYSLHIVTSGWQKQIEGNLNYHDINKYFTHKRYADHSRSKHEKLTWILETELAQPTECLFVTDTVGDLHEAHMVHVPSIAVTFGYHQKPTLAAGKPSTYAESWQDLEEKINTYQPSPSE